MFRVAGVRNQTGEPDTMPSENPVHIAIELSFSSWLVAARLTGAKKSRLHRIEGGDTGALLALIAELRSRALTQLGGVVLLRGGSGRVLAASTADGARHTCLRARADQYPGEPPLASSQNRPARPRGYAARARGLAGRRQTGVQHGARAYTRGGGRQETAPRARAPRAGEAAHREPDRGTVVHARHPSKALATLVGA